jgi:hypothetical protein
MTMHRDHRAHASQAGSWSAWAAVALVAAWAVWWVLPQTALVPGSMTVQLLVPLLVHLAAAGGIGWGLWRGHVPSTPGQLALVVLGAAITMESVALLLIHLPPTV